MPWSQKQLRKIVEAEDLHVSPLPKDGATYGTPTWISCVAVDHDLYVRADDGATSRPIDDTYRAKCPSSPYLGPMIGARVRGASVKVEPRGGEARSSGPRDKRE